MNYLDISLTTCRGLIHWPTDKLIKIHKIQSIAKGHSANVTQIDMSVHTGTHIDAPIHFIKGGKAVDQLSLNKLLGKCYVYDIGRVDVIDVNILNKIVIPKNVKKILFKTKNSNLWRKKKFYKKYVALTKDAAKWITKKRIDLVGIDYLSIQRFNERNNETHKILLSKGIIILEGLNLQNIKQGVYELIVLPIKIKDSDGAPARAILKTL